MLEVEQHERINGGQRILTRSSPVIEILNGTQMGVGNQRGFDDWEEVASGWYLANGFSETCL